MRDRFEAKSAALSLYSSYVTVVVLLNKSGSGTELHKSIPINKQPPFGQRNRLFSSIRFAIAVSLVTAAAAMAFVAVNPSRFLLGKADTKPDVNKLIQQRAQYLRSKL